MADREDNVMPGEEETVCQVRKKLNEHCKDGKLLKLCSCVCAQARKLLHIHSGMQALVR